MISHIHINGVNAYDIEYKVNINIALYLSSCVSHGSAISASL